MRISLLKGDFKSTLHLAWPMIVSQLSYIFMSAVDNIMIAKLGVDELATAAFCNNIFSVFIVTQMGLASAVAPLIANAVGSGKPLNVGKYYRHALFLLLGFSILMAFIMLGAGFNVDWFKQDQVVNDMLWDYFPYLVVSLPIIAIQQAHKQLHDGIEDSKTPMIYLYMSIPLNVFLNWILIYGNLGAPELGLAGAGIATVISRVLVVVVFTYRTQTSAILQKAYQLSFLKFKPEAAYWRSILKLGIPSSFQYLFEVGAFATAGILAGQLGKIEIASHQIALNIASVPFMVALGWSFATSIKIGAALGENDIAKCRRLGFNSITVVIGYMFVTASLLVLLRNHLPLIYLDTIEIVSLVSGLMVVAAAFQLADGIQAVALGMLRGFQDVKIPTLITFVSYWVFAMPLAYYLAFFTSLKVYGIWIALASGLYLSACLLILRFHIITKTRIAKLAL